MLAAKFKENDDGKRGDALVEDGLLQLRGRPHCPSQVSIQLILTSVVSTPLDWSLTLPLQQSNNLMILQFRAADIMR
jgi:hypothetical protein